MRPIYRLFGDEGLDYSDEAALEMYLFESRGVGNLRLGLFNSQNGYANGKHWLNVTVAMWLEDIAAGLLFKHELYVEFEKSYHWWLDKVLKDAKDNWLPWMQKENVVENQANTR